MDQSYTDRKTPDTETLKRDFLHLRASLDAVKDKLGENAHDILDRISAQLESGNLSARLGGIEDELAALGGRLKDTGRDAATKLEGRVSEKPLASIALAFGLGLLAASLLRRNR